MEIENKKKSKGDLAEDIGKMIKDLASDDPEGTIALLELFKYAIVKEYHDSLNALYEEREKTVEE